jgi:hypothetical protein
MALPDGAHELTDDLVYFSLPPDVHCVSCFRQVDAIDAVTHSAAATARKEDSSVAARGSVQKSVVLLCRLPLFGYLATRLVSAVRDYFQQGDFARTDNLASLYHSLNVSLSHPALSLCSTLFQGISLRAVLQALGPQTLAVLKLILLEKRVVFYSHPVYKASSAVVAFTSLLPGALDSIVPSMPALDSAPPCADYGLPLALFGPSDRVSFQPYAPLPVMSSLLANRGDLAGCVIGTSQNVGLLLATTAANAARKVAASKSAATPAATARAGGFTVPCSSLARPLTNAEKKIYRPNPIKFGSTNASQLRDLDSTEPLPISMHERSRSSLPNEGRLRNDADVTSRPTIKGIARRPSGRTGGDGGRLPVVHALVNLSTGKVSVASSLEPLCRITRQERRLLRDLMVSVSAPLPSAGKSLNESDTSSDDYIRGRLREYLHCFLGSAASVPGVLGGPRGGEAWSAEMISHFDLAPLSEYNEQFVSAWLQTRNAGRWARRCSPSVAARRPVPKPELDDSLIDEPLIGVEQVAAGLSGIRDMSTILSNKAAEGLSNLFSRFEAMTFAATPPTPAQRQMVQRAQALHASHSAPTLANSLAADSDPPG